MNKSEKFWDRLAPKYDKPDKKLAQSTIKFIENIKKYLKPSDVVLDYGCATGTFTYEIADSVKEIHGIDISSKMIETAKSRVGERKIENIEFAHATICEKSYGKESFDAILALNVLHLVEDINKVMQRINELLKPGGLIISSTACMGETGKFFSKLISIPIFLLTKLGILPKIIFFKISELEDSITNGKFQIVKTETKSSNAATTCFIVAKKV